MFYQNSLKLVRFSCATISDSDKRKIFLPCTLSYLVMYTSLLALVLLLLPKLAQCKTVTKVLLFRDPDSYLSRICLLISQTQR
jgi:hypothetical protein